MKHFVSIDFEYRKLPNRLEILCVVAQCLSTRRTWRQWLGGEESPSPSFPCGSDVVFVAHAIAAAEARCLVTLGWPFPYAWIDTFVEEKVLAKGARLEEGFGLLACCRRRGIPVIADYQKEDMRALCLRPGDHSPEERKRILEYCESDVIANAALFHAIRNEIAFEQAWLRGLVASEYGRITECGIPVDMSRAPVLLDLGNAGLRTLFAEHLDSHQILRNGSLDMELFAALVEKCGLSGIWPKTPQGRLMIDKDTLKEMAKIHGQPWEDVQQLMKSVRGAGVDSLVVRDDGRLVADLKPFGTLTGRCAPSTSSFLWNGPKWLRFLLQPPPGRTVLVMDWSNQEFGVAAALSQDQAMLDAYLSGDPYLAFAKQAGHVPAEATATEFPEQRARFKVLSLAVLMGMTEWGIAKRLGVDLSTARELLNLHRRTFRYYWRWSDDVASTAAANLPLETAFGLVYQPGRQSKERTARNFLLQATGSDMLRVALALMAEKGIEILATVHDSVMVECDTAQADEIQRISMQCMLEASRIVLWDRLELRMDVTRVDHPFHYQDSKGRSYWLRLAGLIDVLLDDHGG